MAEFHNRRKKKVCQMCAGKEFNYKDVDALKKYVSADRGRILSRRATGNCAKHQRAIVAEIKNARHMALLPFVK